MLIFYDFIQVYVITTNHHLNGTMEINIRVIAKFVFQSVY